MNKDCWMILGIPPTSDKGIIRKTYLNLMKQYHPDRARTPEEVRKKTIKCYQINNAYERALKEAAFVNEFNATGQRQERTEQRATQQEKEHHTSNGYSGWFLLATYVCILIIIIGLVLGLYALKEGGTVPEVTVRGIIGSTMMALVIGTMMLLFPMLMFMAIGIEIISNFTGKYAYKIVWFLTIIFNIVIYPIFIKRPLWSSMPSVYDDIIFVVGVVAVPLFLLVQWILELIFYNKVKDNVDIEDMRATIANEFKSLGK